MFGSLDGYAGPNRVVISELVEVTGFRSGDQFVAELQCTFAGQHCPHRQQPVSVKVVVGDKIDTASKLFTIRGGDQVERWWRRLR